ncbi:hypothetical protein I317_06157 [Kwoniella heveanensis CBS 569]|nr:hypothetical protein I317_06157 [Kwoniella heveanensis CBS 569]
MTKNLSPPPISSHPTSTKITSIGSESAQIRILYIGPTSNHQANVLRAKHFTSRISSDVSIDFYNAPKAAPRSIDGTRDGVISTALILQDLGLGDAQLKKDDHNTTNSIGVGSESDQGIDLNGYGALIVGCFSNHPLVPALRESLPATPRVPPIISLMEVAIFFALQLGPTFGIVTTGRQWEPIFDEAVRALGISPSRYAGTRGCGHNAASVGDSVDGAVQPVIEAAIELVKNGASVIVLGCGAMITMRKAIEDAVSASPEIQARGRVHVPVIEGVQGAIDQAIAFARMKVSSASSR